MVVNLEFIIDEHEIIGAALDNPVTFHELVKVLEENNFVFSSRPTDTNYGNARGTLEINTDLKVVTVKVTDETSDR